MGSIVAAVFPLTAAYDRGNNLAKFSIPAYQILDIFMLLKQFSHELFQSVFNFSA